MSFCLKPIQSGDSHADPKLALTGVGFRLRGLVLKQHHFVQDKVVERASPR